MRTQISHVGLFTLGVLFVGCIIETFVTTAARLQFRAEDESRLDFLPSHMEWSDVQFDSPAAFFFSYPTTLALSALFTLVLIYLHRASVVRSRALSVQVAATRSIGAPHIDSSEDSLRLQLTKEGAKRAEILEPLLGATLVTSVLWLMAVVVGSKLDLRWARPFLAPPQLVAQNLQQLGPDLSFALLRSGWHIGQALVLGTLLGGCLGYVLAHFRALQKWTVWHIAIVSALPPFFLTEVFKQLVRGRWVPLLVTDGEIAFKLGVAMATWAVMWPTMAATAHTIGNIDAEYRISSTLLGARSRLEQIRFVELPLVLPPILVNLRVGFVIGLIVLIIGEGNGGPREHPSFGYMYNVVTGDFKIPSLLAFLVYTSALVVVFELVVRTIELRLLGRGRRQVIGAAAPVQERSVVEEQLGCLTAFERALQCSGLGNGWGDISWLGKATGVVSIYQIRKSYEDRTAFEELGDTPREVLRGEFVSVIGRSGAGKSTLLKLLLGIVSPDSPDPGQVSSIRVGGEELCGTNGPSATRRIEDLAAYVAQRPLLMQHMTAEENILFGLRREWARLVQAPLTSTGEFKRRYIHWLLDLDEGANPLDWRWMAKGQPDRKAWDCPIGQLIQFMGLAQRMGSLPSQLSGGEAQRVHLLRWFLLCRPIVFLDEAFSGLDQPLKGMVRDWVHSFSKSLGMTVIYVSHDRADVLQISDRVWFVNDRRIAQDSPPDELYYKPETKQLAVFLGHTNIFSVDAAPVNEGMARVSVKQDVYRERAFSVGDVELLVSAEAPLVDGTIFIPATHVNIVALSREPRQGGEWFEVRSSRFVGGDFFLSLARYPGRETLLLEAVVQDDDLRGLLKRDLGVDPYEEGVAAVLQGSFARAHIGYPVALRS